MKMVVAQVFSLAVFLAVAIAAVFILEVRLAPGAGDPGTATLLAAGALNGERVRAAGEWYRVGSMVLLHGSPEHLLFNEAALLAAGLLFESIFGAAWFLLAFCAGGLGASLMSLATDPPELTVVGASGAILGVCGAGFLGSLRVDDAAGDSMRRRSLIILLGTMLPWLSGEGVSGVDNVAHVGGVLGGALVGIFLLRYWPSRGAASRSRPVVAVLALLVGLLFLLAAASAALAFRHSPFRHLAADSPAAATLADAERLVAAYPDDPRAWEQRGRQYYGAQHFASAEADFRTALRLADGLQPLFPVLYGTTLRGLVALALSLQGRQEDATAMAQTACAASVAEIGSDFHDALRQSRLCPP